MIGKRHCLKIFKTWLGRSSSPRWDDKCIRG